MTIIGTICFGLFGLFMIVDGLFMLISPPAWFRLPRWISGVGKLNPEQHTHGSGAMQIRVLGVIMIGLPLWVLYITYFYRQ
jgi:hypothetical protein